jgi:hypothetical protein
LAESRQLVESKKEKTDNVIADSASTYHASA